MKKVLGLLVCLSLLVASGAMAGVVHVPATYSTIHAAVQACPAGDTVQVAAGTYADCTHQTGWPSDHPAPACVIMKSDVTVIGAGMEETIIDAEGNGRGFYLFEVANIRIENLQVRNAFAAMYGGGIVVRYGGNSIEINDVKIYQNLDGGIICYNDASPIIRRCDMIENEAKQGGGLAAEDNSHPQVYDCLITGNSAPAGAGVAMRTNANVLLSNCIIASNTVSENSGYGGGIYVDSSIVTIEDCTISGNTVPGYGGGIAFGANAGGTVTNCQILNNTNSHAYGNGGGIYANSSNPAITNCTIAGNSASGAYGLGGGIAVNFDPSPLLTNCTIADNACGPQGAGGGIMVGWFCDVQINNCIISGSTQGGGFGVDPDFAGSSTVSCTDIWGNAGGNDIIGTDAGGNFSADPDFCGVNDDNPYGIGDDSPCAPGHHPDSACDDALIGAGPVGCATGISENAPRLTHLLGNAPNPFNPKTTIFFVIDEAGPVSIRIFDVSGRTIRNLTKREMSAGSHEVVWNGVMNSGQRAGSGVYLYELNALGETQSRRMILVK
ncbi:MAG: T9SS type A sorting domain-containing protein [bacterium]|nr:T9SS type A sorting domain-containing protein [bacterium]